jgi:DNA-binding PadR family transcriptional regulator
MTSNAGARPGFNDALILSALSAGSRYGLEVIERTGLSSGTVYPALRRLEAGGLVEADWEVEESAHAAGRPARRYYRLTPAGALAMEEAVARINARQRALGWGQS